MLGSVIGMLGSGLVALVLGWLLVLALRATEPREADDSSVDPRRTNGSRLGTSGSGDRAR
jgi:hypothetical protein